MGDDDLVFVGVLVWYEPLQKPLPVWFQVLKKRSNFLNDPICSLICSVWHSRKDCVKSCKPECVLVVFTGH